MVVSPFQQDQVANNYCTNNNNGGINRAAERRRRARCGKGVHFSVPEEDTTNTSNSKSEEEPIITRNYNNDSSEEEEEEEEEEDEDDDDEDNIEMPPLIPRWEIDYNSSDSDSDSDSDVQSTTKKKAARKPSTTKKNAARNNHESSSPTTNSGLSLRRLGLNKAGFGDSRQQRVCERTNNERFSASFGVSAKTLEAVFLDMKKRDPSLKEEDFLLGVDALKLYLTEHTAAGRWGCCEQTYREKWKKIVAAIAALREDKIKFDPSDFPEDQVFLLTVDGVNFSIREPRVNNPGSHWYDHKTHSAGLTYLVAVDVRRSRICFIDGPRPGKYFSFVRAFSTAKL